MGFLKRLSPKHAGPVHAPAAKPTPRPAPKPTPRPVVADRFDSGRTSYAKLGVQESPAVAPRAAPATTTSPAGGAVPANYHGPIGPTPYGPLGSSGAEAHRIAELARTDPQGALSELHTLVEDYGSSPDFTRELLAGTQDTVAGILRTTFGPTISAEGSSRPDGEAIAGQLISIASLAGPEASAALGRAVAAAGPEAVGALGDALDDAGPASLNLAAASAEALRAAGWVDQAERLGDIAADGLQSLREDFEDAQEEVNGLNADLSYFVSQYGPGLPPEDLDRAIQTYKDEHAEAYARYEQTGAALAAQLQTVGAALAEGDGVPSGDLRDEAARVYGLLPGLGQTQAGRQELAAALIDQGEGRPSFLDQASDYADTLDGDEKDAWLEGTRGAVISAAGTGAAAYARGEGLDQAAPLFEGLQHNAGLLGIDPAHLQDVTDGFTELAEAESPEAIAEATRSLGITFDAFSELGPESGLGQSLRGLGAVVGAFSSIVSAGDFPEQPLDQQVKYVADTLNVGVGGSKLVFEALEGAGTIAEGSRLASLASGAGRVLGPAGIVLTGVTAVIDGITAVNAFQEGRYTEGAAASANALGGATLAITGVLVAAGIGSEAVPVVGTIVGSVLLAAGFGLSLFGRAEEASRLEGPAQHFLETAGVPEDIAHELRNTDPSGRGAGLLFQDVAERLGVTPREFFDYLRTLPADDVKRIVEAAHEVIPNDGDEWRETADNDETAGTEHPYRGGVTVEAAHSVTGFAHWLEHQGFEVPGASLS
ncbi:MAG: hypothetical protein K1X89_25120 [Myxococcaceae bacterium]|nr:hypothetical protein [Myxococcaceae bacterium]